METSFFSGSENLYKYFVTVGLLLIVSAVYYPLKEKQELEIKKIELEVEVKILGYSIEENFKNVERLKSKRKNGKTEEVSVVLPDIKKLHNQNYINHFKTEGKLSEINIREKYIKLYGVMFWVFCPLGCLLTILGFFKWQKTKKYDDNILKLESEKLEIEVNKLRNKSYIILPPKTGQ